MCQKADPYKNYRDPFIIPIKLATTVLNFLWFPVTSGISTGQQNSKFFWYKYWDGLDGIKIQINQLECKNIVSAESFGMQSIKRKNKNNVPRLAFAGMIL